MQWFTKPLARAVEWLLPAAHEERERAVLVVIIGLVVAGLSVLIFILTTIVALSGVPTPISDFSYTLGGLVFATIVLWLNRTGHVTLAGWILVFLILAAATGQAYLEGNPTADLTGAFVLMLAPVVAVPILKPREAWLVAAVAAAIYIAMHVLWLTGNLPPQVVREKYAQSVYMMILWAGFCAAILYIVQSTTASLRRQKDTLEQQVEERTLDIKKGHDETQRLNQELMNMIDNLDQTTVQLEQEKEQAEAVLRTAGDAIITLSNAGTVTAVNPAFEHQTGYSAEDVVGKQAQEFAAGMLPPGTIEQLEPFAQTEEGWRGEMPVTRKDGTQYDADLILSRITQEGTEGGYVIVMSDISPFKELSRMKDAFLSTAAHELRTPLTSVRAFSELLLMRDFNEERRRRYLTMIMEQSQRLADIINDLLDLSKLEAQGGLAFSFEPVKMVDLAQEAILPLADTSPQHRFELEGIEDLPLIWGDRFRLGQVLSNLFSNAVKYSPQGGLITFTGKKTGHLAEFSVMDEGIGMSDDVQRHVFERFFRASSTIPGTGLGLAICKLIVERHGGEIRVESTEGQGSTIHFSLPLAEGPHPFSPEEHPLRAH